MCLVFSELCLFPEMFPESSRFQTGRLFQHVFIALCASDDFWRTLSFDVHTAKVHVPELFRSISGKKTRHIHIKWKNTYQAESESWSPVLTRREPVKKQITSFSSYTSSALLQTAETGTGITTWALHIKPRRGSDVSRSNFMFQSTRTLQTVHATQRSINVFHSRRILQYMKNNYNF